MAFEAPPFPRIIASFLLSNKGKILFSNPIISVLYPYNLSSTIFIVFQAPIVLAVFSEIYQSKTFDLYGIVIFMLINCFYY